MSMPRSANGRCRQASCPAKPVAGTKLSGSTVIRSDCCTAIVPVKKLLTVIATVRLRPIIARASSTKPCARPAKLTRRCCAAQ